MSVTVVVSRSSFDCLLKNNNLFSCLSGRELVYIYSIRAIELPPKGSYKELHLIDLRGSENQLKKLVESIQSRHKVDQILYLSEQEVIPVAIAQESLGFKNLNLELANNFRNKPNMNIVADNAHIATNEIFKGDTLEDLISFVDQHKKVVVKPKSEAGSIGVHILNDAVKAFDLYDKDTMLIQSYNENDLYHLDALVRDGQLVFSSLGKYTVPCADYISNKWKSSIITNEDSPLHRTADLALLRYIEVANARNGVFHFEFFSEGENLTLCEIALRPGGGGIAQVIDNACGINLFEEHVKWQLGLSTDCVQHTKPIYYTATMSYFNKKSGTFKGLDTSKVNDLIDSINLHQSIGKYIEVPRNGSDELFDVYVTNQQSYSDLMRAMEKIENYLNVIIE